MTAVKGPRQSIYRGQVVDLGIEEARLPDGRTVPLEIVRHPGGAAVVPLDEQRRVCLLRQYRHAAGGWLWEVPAGKLDPGEDAERAVRRELVEEAGLLAHRLESLGEIFPTPGFCDERLALFLAREPGSVPRVPQEHELIEIHWLDFATALEWAADGRIQDAKTLVALFRAREHMG